MPVACPYCQCVLDAAGMDPGSALLCPACGQPFRLPPRRPLPIVATPAPVAMPQPADDPPPPAALVRTGQGRVYDFRRRHGKQKDPFSPATVAGYAAAFLAIAAAGWLLVRAVGTHERKTDSTSVALFARQAAEERLEKVLLAPSTAEYPLLAVEVFKTGDRTWRVRGPVDSQNGFGAMIRNRWEVDLQETGPNDFYVIGWRVNGVEIGGP